MSDGTAKTFRFWCQKALPLVYDNSLSYYEVLCKVVEYLNNVVGDDKEFTEELAQLQEALIEVQEFIDNFNTDYAEKIIKDTIATMIFVGINDAGYIYYVIPDSWDNIEFNTTGLDIELELQPDYGHLVLSY